MTCEIIIGSLSIAVVFLGVSLSYCTKKLHKSDERVRELSRTLESVAANYQVLHLMRKDKE